MRPGGSQIHTTTAGWARDVTWWVADPHRRPAVRAAEPYRHPRATITTSRVAGDRRAMKTSRGRAFIAIASLLAATVVVVAAARRTPLAVESEPMADGVVYAIKVGDKVVYRTAVPIVTTSTAGPPASDQPPTTDQPTTTDQPPTTDQPVATQEPATTHEPATTQEPTTTEEPTTTLPPDPVPSGIAMPLDAPANFPTTVMREDFNTPAGEGDFLNVYEPRNISAYPNTYRDTRSNYVKASNAMNYGTYDPDIISVPEGAGYMQMSLRTVDKSIRVAAPVPYLDPTNTDDRWHDAKNVRVSICWKSDILPTRKVAWMLWPRTGTNTTGATHGRKNSHGKHVGGNGEIDFPEANLDGNDTIGAFVHWQNG